MSRIVEYESKASANTGVQYTEEEKAEYAAKWLIFAKRMGNRPIGARRNFGAIVTDITDPMTVPNTFKNAAPGSMRVIRKFTIELTDPGVEGLRFVCDSADNVQNDKTRLHALYKAVTGEIPPQYGRFSFDLDTLINVPVNVVIEKGKPREDGKRGGFNANAVDFEGVYADEEDEVPVPKSVPSARTAGARSSASTTAGRSRSQATQADDDEVPF